ncbi:MAG: tRNA methyltransferase [Desulfovibrio sp.]|jgi:tRNA (guanosine-2'-O-)-methyltransferase|nr:tRNA methyltransferase [Desulfovibrio sp.]
MSSAKIITPEREARIRLVLEYRQKDLTLVLGNIHDPHNVSAIFRSCDAFGVPEVHLYYTDTAFPALGAKSSASARKWVKTIRHREKQNLRDALRAKNMRVLAASCNSAARPVHELDLTGPTAFIMGNEHRGVDAELLDISDSEVYIPMYGMIQSFNVSVAAALLLAEASRQRKAAGAYDRRSYNGEEFAALYLEWTSK